ncbi:unnamed protein product [Brachionus calyciflorus]|uniref:EF-hand domain-containing protein n=1 Tax=Brachionus calyciflorus TaxID=104777 RepID=A0A813M6R4_9BILA|nr:unnamed protein product [Brachionus calyciflorus]
MPKNFDLENMSISEQERILLNKVNSSYNNQVDQDVVLMDILNSTGSRLTFDNINSLSITQSRQSNVSHPIVDSSKFFRNSNDLSEIEAAILRSTEPINLNETEEIVINGEKGILANKSEIVNWKGAIPLSEYKINDDPDPEIIHKKANQSIVYNQEVAIRYLRPPTPPPPGPILIQQEANLSLPPAPPLVIRQQPARPMTPPPLVIREAPPLPPKQVGKKIITISGKTIPPPPRKVIIERLAPLPSKPQSIIIERWLPYRQVKRKVIFARSNEKDSMIIKPKNVIVQWQAPQVKIQKEFKDLGIVKANPLEYVQRYGNSLKRSIELPKFVKEIKPPSGLSLAADSPSESVYELEGDIHALNLVDLEREGLVEYRYNLKNIENRYKNSLERTSSQDYSLKQIKNSIGDSLNELFSSLNLNSNETVSLSEAERIMFKIYARMGRRFGEEEAKIFFRSIDINYAGKVRISDIKTAIENELNEL